VRLPDGEKV